MCWFDTFIATGIMKRMMQREAFDLEEMFDHVQEIFQQSPCKSIWRVLHKFTTPKSTVYKILHKCLNE